MYNKICACKNSEGGSHPPWDWLSLTVQVVHLERNIQSTIFCSQFRESEWHQQICGSESTLADAIMDRISYDSYKIDIESIDSSKDFSMREVYGLDPAMAK